MPTFFIRRHDEIDPEQVQCADVKTAVLAFVYMGHGQTSTEYENTALIVEDEFGDTQKYTVADRQVRRYQE